MDKYLRQLNKKFRRGEISFDEMNKYSEEYNNRGITYDAVSKETKSSTESNLTDRELQEQILKTLKHNQQDNRVIKNWVVFWSWLLIIGFILITLFRLNYY